uniref:Uncharacterized protein n=1 Tax=Micrurus carvalhoi TaxID=3147026 RepID=A0A2H6MUD5_9SAUR
MYLCIAIGPEPLRIVRCEVYQFKEEINLLPEARAPDGQGPGFGEESGGECGFPKCPPSFLAGCAAIKAGMKFPGSLPLQMTPKLFKMPGFRLPGSPALLRILGV